MNKKIKYLFLVLCMILSITACAPKSEDLLSQDEKVKSVKVAELKQKTIPINSSYIGTVGAKEMKKYSFKSSGNILEVHVGKGDKVTKGQMLMQLDTQELSYAVDGAKAQYDVALAQYNKAENGATDEDINNAEQNVNKAQLAYTYSNDTYEQTQELYKQGAVSEDVLDKAKLDSEIKSADLDQAKQVEQEIKKGTREEDKQALYNQLKSAEINYESKKSMLNDSALTSDIDGYVADILYKEGELIPAGYIAVIIVSNIQVVNVGLTQKDISKVAVGTQVQISVDEEITSGKIIQIDKIPDAQSLTYNVQIELQGSALYLGQLLKIFIPIEECRGIWISIDSVMIGAEDYVYVIKENLAFRVPINIERTIGSQVMVSGLSEGDMLVLEGSKSLSEGQKVIIQQ